jgi:nicotinate-nucleotide adenylyltransferase
VRGAAIGVLGGTFDPVHHGHLRLALEVRELLQFSQVRLIPLASPPHRAAPLADADLRLAMLHAAVANEPGLIVDDRELQRGGPSYTIDTLTSLRVEFPDNPFCLILGMDAFAGLPTWKRWQELCELAHLVVAHRPGAVPPSDPKIQALLAQRECHDPDDLQKTPAGYIYLASLPLLDISSSRIRSYLAKGRNPRYLLPDAVLNIINTQQLYQTNHC